MTPPYPNAMKRYGTLRQSLLAGFDNCPLSVKLDQDLHSDLVTTPDQARGQLVHRTLARCLETMHMQGEEQMPPGEALEIYYEELRQRDVGRECVRCDSRDLKPTDEYGGRKCGECGKTFHVELVTLPVHHIADGRLSVLKWSYDTRWSIQNLASVEELIRTDITYTAPDGSPVHRTLSGRLDALFIHGDRAIVPDWKDTWAMPAESSVSDRGYFQQRFYGLLVLRQYPRLNRVTLREFYLRYSEPREATLDRADLDDVEAELSALVERFDRTVEESIWRPSPGAHCTLCAAPTKCPIIKVARGAGAIEDADQARRWAAGVVAGREAIGRMNKAVKAWSAEHGPVPVSDAKGRREFGFVETSTTVKPTRDELEAALRAHGENVPLDQLYRAKKGTKFDVRPVHEGAPPTPEDQKVAEELRSAVDRLQDPKAA